MVEYSTNVWDFDDYGYAGSANWTNFSDPQYNQTGTPKTMLYVTTDVEPPFSAGDLIVVNQDSGTTPPFRPEIEGIQKVLDIEQVSSAPVEWMVVIDKPWIGSGIASTGSTDFADGSKSQTLDLLTQSCLVFNGSEPLISFGDWDADDWYMNHPNIGNFLTSMPRSGFRVRPDSKVFLQIYQDGADSVEFTSASGSNGSYSLTAPNAVEMIDASPSKLNTLDDYTVHIEDSSNNRISEQLSFTIDTACYGYEDLEICFLDRRGSILPFQFRLKRTQRQSVNRETYKHDITSDEMYDIDLLDAGQEDLHITEDITYTLRTAVMTLQEAIYLRELISSPFTVVRFGDGEYQRCEVLTRSIEIKDEYFEGARMEDIEIRLSNQDSVNW